MFQPKTIFLVAPGINNWGSIFGDFRDWPTLFSLWINRNLPGARSHAFFYFTTFLTVGLMENHRARSFGRLIKAYTSSGFRVHGVGHSNGTRVWLSGLRYAGWPKIETLHLLNGACDADCGRNGLVSALTSMRIKKVFTYIGGRDNAMKIEDTLLGRRLFGLRGDPPLGLGGPTHVPDWMKGTRVIEVCDEPWGNYGHSDALLKKNFDATMRQIVANAQR